MKEISIDEQCRSSSAIARIWEETESLEVIRRYAYTNPLTRDTGRSTR